MKLHFDFDAYTPGEIAARVQVAGVSKARMPLLPLVMLGLLAGAFIGLGSLFYVVVVSDETLGFAPSRLTGGVVFSLGLLLVVVAGAELFTGNNLLAMAWADGRVSAVQVLRNWAVVCLANFAGAAMLAALVYASGHAEMNGGAIGRAYVEIAAAKAALPPWAAFFRGVLANVLVCLAVWMSFAGRSVADKFVAIVFPVSAFVAAGFEHSIANMYFLPLGCALGATAGEPISFVAMGSNLMLVIAGNLIGGSVMVALVYHLIYGRGQGSMGDAVGDGDKEESKTHG
jgi:formate transporter